MRTRIELRIQNIKMLTAITRGVGPTFSNCNLEFLSRQPIDVARAVEQHRGYEDCLRGLGLNVVSLPANPEFPDGLFVEDPAIVLEEVAIICRMGAEVRRKEAPSLAESVAKFRPLKWVNEPGTLEGGDVVRIGKTLYAGVSPRSNREGSGQLAELIRPYGYRVVPVPVTGCMHLKSACCWIGEDTVLANRKWMESGAFADFRILDVPEPWAADVLRVGDTVIVPASFPRTRDLLEKSGFHTKSLDVAELQKAEAGVTCMSLIFDASPGGSNA
jgi:dimethylargininase